MPSNPNAGRLGRAVRDDLWLLVDRAQRGDPEAFGELYERTRKDVYELLWYWLRDHHAAEDLTAETYLKALRFLSGLRRVGESPIGWLKTIAMRLAATHCQRPYRRHEYSVATVFPLTAEGRYPASEGTYLEDGAADPVHQRLAFAEVWQAAEQLTADERDALIGRYLLGLPVSETGDWMGGRSTDSVRALTYRAVGALRRDPRVAGLHPARHMAGA